MRQTSSLSRCVNSKKIYTFETMQLSQYISNLLYRYECVVVPGFGAFLTHKIPASIHQPSNTFYPPKKRLSFNGQLQSNDGVLANHIAESEQISYENAIDKITKQVVSLEQRLKKDETVILPNIGELKRTKKGQLLFEPYYSINYLTESFGLSPFVSPEISKFSDNKAPIVLTSRKQKTQVLFKYAAVAVLMLGLGGFFGSNAYLKQIEQQNILAQQNANIALDNKIQEATFVLSNPLPAVTLELERSFGSFHIVAGAFRVEANSERKLRQLKRLGFNARKIGQNRYGLHQVVYESFRTRPEAERALYTIKRTQDAAAWLLIKEVP